MGGGNGIRIEMLFFARINSARALLSHAKLLNARRQFVNFKLITSRGASIAIRWGGGGGGGSGGIHAVARLQKNARR